MNATAKNMDWISCAEKMPEPGRHVLATYVNSHGNRRVICAYHAPLYNIWIEPEDDDDTAILDYDEEQKGWFLPEGWYEKIDNIDEFSSVPIDYGEVTHWMPLPSTDGL